MAGLELSKDLVLPIEAITETFAFLAKRGAGKTYTAGVFAEEMLAAGAQVVVLDPVGKWWGLRLLGDGVKPAFEIPVFGGRHGDLPLNPKGGKLAAQLVVRERLSAVFDVMLFESDNERRRFVEDFCRELYLLKSHEDRPTPLHLILEEAEEFVPQNFTTEDARMIGAVKKIFKLGRNFGLGGSLISQRSADLNKKALSQVEYLVALRTRSPHDLKAIREWIDHAGDESARDTIKALPTLPVGAAYVYGGDTARRVQIRRKRTLDTSATPKHRAGAAPGAVKAPRLSDERLGQIRAAMTAAGVDLDTEDPKSLRRRVAELERELRAARRDATRAAPPREVTVEVPVPVTPITPQQVELLQGVASAVGDHARLLSRELQQVETALERVKRGEMPFGPTKPAPRPPVRAPSHAPAPARPPVSARPAAVPAASPAPAGIRQGALDLLRAIASLHPRPVTMVQAATLAGQKPRSSTVRGYLAALRQAGHVDGSGSALTITDAGHAVAGPVDGPRTTEDLLDLWCPRLGEKEEAILRLAAQVYPDSLSKSDLERVTGTSASSSTMRAYLARLRRNGLITSRGVRASDTLFPER